MGYKRANWHSGLTYVQTCEECGQVLEYTDEKLGFRPWYPDGFVYCTRCQTPLRHNEAYAINKGSAEVAQGTAAQTVQAPAATSEERPRFCTKCGRKFGDSDNFCAGCGAKR